MTEPQPRSAGGPAAPSAPLPPEILADGGRMGAEVRARDWSRSPLGPAAGWPRPLRTAVSIMLNSAHPMFLAWGPELVFMFNDAYRPILGEMAAQALGRPLREVMADVWETVGPSVERALSGDSSWFENQKLLVRRHHYTEEAYFSYSYSPIRDSSGRIAGVFCACTETTGTVLATRKLRETEAALRQANAALQAEREAVKAANRRLRAETDYLRQLFEQAPSFIAILRGPDHVFELANSAYLQLVGRRDVVGRRVRDALPEVEGQGFIDLLNEAVRTRSAVVRHEQSLRLQRGPGRRIEQRFVDFVYQPILEPDGAVSGIFVEGFDVTERVLAERQLRRLTETLEEQIEARTRDLREAEAELRQSQKMEAVGQLTGGIAHDFNNLLMGITGALGLAQRQLAQGRSEQLGRFIGLALDSAQRAAALTHRLLAFSRRQPLAPRPVDINRLVQSMEDLIRRTIGESICLLLDLGGELPPALCDPNQLENALLNLVINARDAMPDGGTLTITTGGIRCDAAGAGRLGVKEGRYLCLNVADTGTGMQPETIARVFEPFFTTKPLGQGTGLGLSMVYGFVRQSEGHVQIDSAPDRGTTVRICLPEAPTAAASTTEAASPAAAPRRAVDAVVLLVEDEAPVRALIGEHLRAHGYRVLEAADGVAGLETLRSKQRIDLLLTDIGLPGLNGRQLGNAARELRQDLKVLFITAYADAVGGGHGFTQPGMALLTKPFELDALTTRIEEMLAHRPGD